MGDDVVYNKCSIIERCIVRIHEEYENDPKNLENYTKQDSIILNIQRGCEAAIDLAMYIVAEEKWGIPQNSREVTVIVGREGESLLSNMEDEDNGYGLRCFALNKHRYLHHQ